MYKLKIAVYVFVAVVGGGAVGFAFAETWGIWLGLPLALPVAFVLGTWAGEKTVYIRAMNTDWDSFATFWDDKEEI